MAWSFPKMDLSRLHWFVDYTAMKTEGSPRQGKILTLRAMDSGRNNALVIFVAGIGFFTDSYILFASNSILPMLGYVYWNTATSSSHVTAINSATLAGCIFGMVLFGCCGDIFGRRKMYGIELIILIVGTLGVVMSSPGYTPAYSDTSDIDWEEYGSMNIVTWLIFWRFVSGVGIGGDYPLSAVMVSEFAPTSKRARMLAATFSMQAFGYAAATLVSLIVVAIVRNQNDVASARSVDQIWRWVMGLGLIPAAIAVVLRRTMPESPRYTLDVINDPLKAFDEANRFTQAGQTGLQEQFQRQTRIEIVTQFAAAQKRQSNSPSDRDAADPADPSGTTETSATLRGYFWTEGNWRWLFATTQSWLLLDFAFYGLGFNSPATISKIWYVGPPVVSSPAVWDTDFEVTNPEADIYTILTQNATHSLVVSSIGAVLGSMALVYAINHFNRKRLQWTMFLILAALFVVIGATFQATVQTQFHGITIMLYCLCQACFYFGPNSLTFIIPAELFPTKYRSSCHGISAAAGKLGSVVVQLFLAYVKFGSRHDSGTTSASNPHSKWLGWVLLIFALPMIFGAFVTWKWLPELQDKNGENLQLEDLVSRLQGRPQELMGDDETPV